MPRLFQDAAGTIPAVLPGQSVGLIQRAAGTADLSQAIASLKPTLARWPRGGRRNMATQTENLGASPWVLSEGISVTTGVLDPDGGNSACRITWDTLDAVTRSVRQKISALSGINTTARVQIKGPAGQVVRIRFGMAPGDITNYTLTGDWQNVVVVSAGGTSISDDIGFYRNTVAGANVKQLDVYQLQFEAGAVQTPYQKVVTANDITEAGVDDVWHLFFDGVDDALGVTLPAGTYGRARVSELGVVTVDSVTDPTSLTFGAATRVADFMLRQGAFSAAEIAALTAYWEGLYK